LVVRKLFENQAFPPIVKFAVGLARIPMLELTAITATFMTPVTFAEVAKTLVVVRLLENQAFPWRERAFPKALAPMPMFEVTSRV
jgi:hypothetical protein